MTPTRREAEEKRESTSLKIRPSVWKEAKIEAIREDIELSEIVEYALKDYVEKKASERGKEKS